MKRQPPQQTVTWMMWTCSEGCLGLIGHSLPTSELGLPGASLASCWPGGTSQCIRNHFTPQRSAHNALQWDPASHSAAGPSSEGGELDRTQDVTRFHLDQQELDNYRTAMKKMADDIQSLRRHVASLEAENSTLRCNLSMHEEVGRTLLNDVDVDVMTKVEIVDRIVALKHKLAAGTVEMSRMKDRVQQLQNELIRKNDREKDLVMLQRAHQQQQTVLRKYHEKITKMKALEDTVRQQERDIFSTNSEKLSLLAKVEKAQGRIRVLESQLEESARKWGREKQDLSTQLLEQEHGFGRPSSTILHDFSLKTSPDPTTHIKRHQTLDPLP
ncbi:coiled-coil domain-containing protein 33-like isoform X9 [Trachemys scripta elegans]|uniref:coiled-coil domain-containing protein 33-like isoform X9 n=1 Tax=Trachemys scripta elegans TaxID=31138 RepID=UPI001556AFF9|nr:coiled-coil domain-containing protein 33-like isoform X9 [Trachemys scripta elegans]